ncbi:MAG: hypothetical protein WA118_05220 [Carboxydocellales bacterium]
MTNWFGSKKLKLATALLAAALTLGWGLTPAWAGTTADAGVVKVEIHHLLLGLQGEVLQVREVLRFNNTGKDVFIGAGKEGIDQKAVLNISAKGGGKVNRSYSGEKVDFHSASHLARWQKSPLRATNPHLWLIFLAIIVGGMAAAITLLVRQKSREQAEVEAEGKLERVFLNLAAKHKRLLNKIKELDEQHESGAIPAETYEEMRDRYKTMLVDVKLKLKRLEDIENRKN